MFREFTRSSAAVPAAVEAQLDSRRDRRPRLSGRAKLDCFFFSLFIAGIGKMRIATFAEEKAAGLRPAGQARAPVPTRFVLEGRSPAKHLGQNRIRSAYQKALEHLIRNQSPTLGEPHPLAFPFKKSAIG